MRLKTILIAVIALTLFSRLLLAEDGPPSVSDGISPNGQYKITLTLRDKPYDNREVKFTVLEQATDKTYRPIAEGTAKLEGCTHWTAYVSDEGRFAIVNIATDKNDKVIGFYTVNGQPVKTLAPIDILNQDEIAALPPPFACPPHLEWCKSISVAGESLCLETLAGRKVNLKMDDQLLEITLTSDKKEYKLNEQPHITAQIKNISDKDVYVLGCLDGSDIGWRYPKYTVEIMLNGNPVSMTGIGRCGNMDPLRSEDFRLLKPGEMFNPFGEGFFPHEKLHRFKPDTTGEYRLKLVYDTRTKENREFFGDLGENEILLLEKLPRLKITSNELIIKVLPP